MCFWSMKYGLLIMGVQGGSLVPFANFGSVTFSGASAVAGSNTVDTSGAAVRIILVVVALKRFDVADDYV